MARKPLRKSKGRDHIPEDGNMVAGPLNGEDSGADDEEGLEDETLPEAEFAAQATKPRTRKRADGK